MQCVFAINFRNGCAINTTNLPGDYALNVFSLVHNLRIYFHENLHGEVGHSYAVTAILLKAE